MSRHVGQLMACCVWGLFFTETLVSAPETAATPEGEQLAKLERRFQAGLDAICSKHELPGMTAAYVMPDGRLAALATGLADQESGAKMAVDARMPAGSIGNMFVAATVVGLAHEGKLSLDDKVEKWLGDQPWFDQLPNAQEMTIRHLLMHRGGIADHVYEPAWVEAAQQMVRSLDTDPDHYFKPVELVKYILNREPLFAVGEDFQYTDTGYILLGLVIERAGEASYYEQVTQRFLEPLALELTTPANRRDIENLAAGYVSPENPFGLPEKMTVDGKLCYNPATEWTGGGLVSNSQDLARWAKQLFEGDALSAACVAEIVATHPRDKGKKRQYGLGVYVGESELGTSYGHGGWSVGYQSLVEYFPSQRVAVAVQVNTDVRDDMLGDVMALVADVLQTADKVVAAPH